MKAGTWRQLEDHHWRQFIVGVAQGSNPLLDTRHVSPSNLPCFMLDHYSESCQTRIHDTVALPCFNINFTGASPVWRGGTRPSLARRNGIPPLVPIVVTHVVKRCASPIPHFNSVFHQKHHIHCFTHKTLLYTCILCETGKLEDTCCTATRLPCGFHRCCNMAEMLPGPAGIFSLSRHIHITKGTSGRCSLLIVASVN